MKKTKDRLLKGASRRLLKTAFAGILAGAMVAMTAMPAFAEGGMLDPVDLQEIEAGSDTFSLNLVFKYDQGENKKSTDIAADVASQIKMRVYKLADLTRGSDAEDFHYVYVKGVPKASEYGTAEYADDLVNALKEDDADVPELVNEYDQMYTNGDLDNVKYQSGKLNDTVRLDGTGLAPCGIYYIHVEYPENADHFSINGTNYTLQSTIITVPNILYNEADGSGHQKDSGTNHEITVCPKPAMADAATPPTPPPGPGGNPPGGGGGNPPRGGRRVTPPSEGSVLGASRDAAEPMPEVLGANRLPQTGQLWWPVPVLCILGLGLISSGVYRRRAALAVH